MAFRRHTSLHSFRYSLEGVSSMTTTKDSRPHAPRESAASPPPSVSVTASWVQSQSTLSATGIPAWDAKT